MLLGLTIRDVVLIDRLSLAFRPGLCVLTGETGAGKSILLDALGLALGRRAEAGLVRPGAEPAVVSAEFAVGPNHPAVAILTEAGIATDLSGSVIVRRTLGADGRSRAFVNDEPTSIALLRALGDSLVEIQGQGEAHGLFDPATHRELLDALSAADTAGLAAAWRAWREAARAAAGAAPRRICCATSTPSSTRWRPRRTRKTGSPRGGCCCRTPSGWARRSARRSARSMARAARRSRWSSTLARSSRSRSGCSRCARWPASTASRSPTCRCCARGSPKSWR